MEILVTTSLGENPLLVQRAKSLAQSHAYTYVERRKQSLKNLIKEQAGALVVYQDKLVFAHPDGSLLQFHPDTAMLRIKASHDPLLDLLGERPLKILDTTMGLASDSIVMAYAGHQVTALESNELIHLVISQGLKTWEASDSRLTQVMRSLETHHCQALNYMREQADKSYDVVYVDPMFSEEIAESDNLADLRPLANKAGLSPAFMAQATRIARQAIIFKGHFRDETFETFGFERQRRPNQKFHYGIYRL